MAYLEDYRSRIGKLEQLPGNRTCADCFAPQPQWASLLLNEEDGRVEGLGVLVCQECALHHLHELGEDRCFLKFLEYFHEWTSPELEILEYSGNALVNGVYEAILGEDERRQQEANSKKQAKFIRNKYAKCRFRDDEKMRLAFQAIEAKSRKVDAMRRRRCSLEFSVRRSSVGGSAYSYSRQSSISNDSRRSSMDNTGSHCSDASSDIDQSRSLDDLLCCSMHSEALSMADTMMGSSEISFDLEDSEEFYLACARESSGSAFSMSSSKPVTKSSSAPSLGVLEVECYAEASPSRIRRADRNPRQPRRRVSNDPGKYHAQMPVRKGRKNLLQRMLTNPDSRPQLVAALRRAETAPQPITAVVRPSRTEKRRDTTTAPTTKKSLPRNRSLSPVRAEPQTTAPQAA